MTKSQEKSLINQTSAGAVVAASIPWMLNKTLMVKVWYKDMKSCKSVAIGIRGGCDIHWSYFNLPN